MSGFVRDHISLYADIDVKLNSLSEDHQDLVPEDETHNVSEIHSFCLFGRHEFSESYRGSFKLLRADKFPKKTDEVLGGNKLRSSIVMEC